MSTLHPRPRPRNPSESQQRIERTRKPSNGVARRIHHTFWRPIGRRSASVDRPYLGVKLFTITARRPGAPAVREFRAGQPNLPLLSDPSTVCKPGNGLTSGLRERHHVTERLRDVAGLDCRKSFVVGTTGVRPEGRIGSRFRGMSADSDGAEPLVVAAELAVDQVEELLL